MSTNRRKERSIAFHFLYAIDRNEYSVTLDDVVADYNAEFKLGIMPQSYAYELAAGCVDQRDELDALLAPVIDYWSFERLGCCTRLILRMGVWEMRKQELDRAVVINEAIELAKSFAERDAYKFVNGVLDRIKLPSAQAPVTTEISQ